MNGTRGLGSQRSGLAFFYQASGVPCFTVLRVRVSNECDMLTRGMWFWKNPVSMFFEGLSRFNQFLIA